LNCNNCTSADGFFLGIKDNDGMSKHM